MCERGEGEGGNKGLRHREMERQGWRERENKRIMLEQEKARKHVCFGCMYVNSCYPSGNSERTLSKKGKRELFIECIHRIKNICVMLS